MSENQEKIIENAWENFKGGYVEFPEHVLKHFELAFYTGATVLLQEMKASKDENLEQKLENELIDFQQNFYKKA